MQNIIKCWLDFAYLWRSVVAVQNRIYIYYILYMYSIYRSPATTKPILHTAEARGWRIRHRISCPINLSSHIVRPGFTVAHTFHIIGTRSCYCMRKCVLFIKMTKITIKRNKIKEKICFIVLCQSWWRM